MEEGENHKENNLINAWWDNLSSNEFQQSFHMSRNTLTYLQAEIDYCEQINKDRLDPVLLACVWLLNNTEPFQEAEEKFNIENVEAVFEDYLPKIIRLASSYIVWPGVEEARDIGRSFANDYNFPSVVGVIGSLHIEVKVDNELFYNDIMKVHTIVLQVVCDNKLLLRDVCVGCPGGESIENILESSPLYEFLTDENSSLCKNNQHILGGTQHPPLETLLTPYKLVRGQKNAGRRKFNTLHSNAMGAIEKTLKCLENRFPRINAVDNLSPAVASLIASAICILHNFTRINNDNCDLYEVSL